jgi:hypothetical protein
MASTYVCGIVGLMLKIEPNLTASQIIGILKRTSLSLPSSDYDWKNDAGFGQINPIACLRKAKQVNQREDLT